MKKITFTIDEEKYFTDVYKLEPEDFKNPPPFKGIYTLSGNGNSPDTYTLTDYDGNKIELPTVSGYILSTILGECMAYYEGRTKQLVNGIPRGVVDIKISG